MLNAFFMARRCVNGKPVRHDRQIKPAIRHTSA
jgi:hypothetical protein